MAKTGIVLAPDNVEELVDKLDELRNRVGDFDYEVLAVIPWEETIPYSVLNSREELKYLVVGADVKLNPAVMCNMSRFLASDLTKNLLFLKDLSEVSDEWLDRRVVSFRLDPVIGVTGTLGKEDIIGEDKKKVLQRLANYVNLTPDDFEERCVLENGAIRYVEEDSMATTVEVFDKLGGFDITSTAPYLDYQCRTQLMGYGTIVLNPIN